MPLPPLQPADFFDAAQSLLNPTSTQAEAFAAALPPSVSGWGTRQSRVPDQRVGVNHRNIMHWLVPEGPIVQMYINPQNVSYNYRKAIQPTRTKGGFTLQYWGEELTTLRLTGTTGSSGIEGINVLYDIYRNEQLALDPYALYLSAAQDAALIDGGSVGAAIGNVLGGSDIGNTIGGIVGGVLQGASESSTTTRPAPSLASLAFTVELYWSGEVYRGYFTDFSVEESVSHLGTFEYSINFTVTQKRGFRVNYLPWHRSAVSGPSNSSPFLGTPHSFAYLENGVLAPPSLESTGSTTLGDIFSSLGI